MVLWTRICFQTTNVGLYEVFYKGQPYNLLQSKNTFFFLLENPTEEVNDPCELLNNRTWRRAIKRAIDLIFCRAFDSNISATFAAPLICQSALS